MRILIDLQPCQSASRERGIGRHSFDMAQAMAAAPGPHEVWIALNAAFPESIGSLRHAFSDLVPKERIAVFATPTPAAVLDPANDWRDRVGEPIRETFLLGLRPDIVHVASLFEGLVDDAITSVGTIRSSHATATTLYDLIPLVTGESLPTPQSIRWYQRKLASLKRSDLLLALSDYVRDEAIAKLQIPADRIVVASTAASDVFRPGALVPDALFDLCARHGITRPFVLHAGGFDARKNVVNLILAYARLPATLRSKFQLVLVGTVDTDIRERLRVLCDREDLSAEDVLLPGRLSDVELAALYGECAVSCVPSFHEGFGLPALEAMACGAAVIGADATSIPEVIGRSDALFDPADVDALAAKLHAVLSDGSFRADLFYRINILSVAVPPLRARSSDILPLATELLMQAARRDKALALCVPGRDDAQRLLAPLEQALRLYPWPGNVRELQNIVERIAVEIPDMEIEKDRPVALSLDDLQAIAPELFENKTEANADLSLRDLGRSVEADQIRASMAAFGGDRDAVCKALGISKTTLWRRLNAKR